MSTMDFLRSSPQCNLKITSKYHPKKSFEKYVLKYNLKFLKKLFCIIGTGIYKRANTANFKYMRRKNDEPTCKLAMNTRLFVKKKKEEQIF